MWYFMSWSIIHKIFMYYFSEFEHMRHVVKSSKKVLDNHLYVKLEVLNFISLQFPSWDVQESHHGFKLIASKKCNYS